MGEREGRAIMDNSSRFAIAVLGMVLGIASSAQALTLATPALTPDQGGYVYCKIVVTSTRPIGIEASIVGNSGANVTDFGSSWRVAPSATSDGRYYAEETAGSFTAGYCKARIKGAVRKDVREMSLSVYGEDGYLVTTVGTR